VVVLLVCMAGLAVDALSLSLSRSVVLSPVSSSANGASWQGRSSGEAAFREQADHVALVALRMFP
jgi:hypothetical protein